MQTSFGAVSCFLVAAFLGALGQFLYKSGSEQATASVASYLLNARLWGGVVCYVAVMALFVAAFRFGGALSVLYPVYATTFIWGALIARCWLNEPIRPANIVGMLVLIVGMGLIGDQIVNAAAPLSERRPIASRERAWAQFVAHWLAERGASPNGISTAGMVCGILAGASLAATQLPGSQTAGFVLAAVLVQLRLLANMFDGMVAIETQRTSPVGELFNEVPDRVSDAATLIGAGYAFGGSPVLGFAAACLALFLAYLRAQGKVAGAHREYCGPMAKQQRMFLVTLAALYSGLIPEALQLRFSFPAEAGTTAAALAVMIVGEVVTGFRRLARISAALQSKAK